MTSGQQTVCEFSELPADQCACTHCRPELVPPPVRLKVERTATAKHPGRCGGCDELIRIDDPIGLTDAGWVCADCGGLT